MNTRMLAFVLGFNKNAGFLGKGLGKSLLSKLTKTTVPEGMKLVKTVNGFKLSPISDTVAQAAKKIGPSSSVLKKFNPALPEGMKLVKNVDGFKLSPISDTVSQAAKKIGPSSTVFKSFNPALPEGMKVVKTVDGLKLSPISNAKFKLPPAPPEYNMFF